jgi:hypothetical protein
MLLANIAAPAPRIDLADHSLTTREQGIGFADLRGTGRE